jgi:hypothetical protein
MKPHKLIRATLTNLLLLTGIFLVTQTVSANCKWTITSCADMGQGWVNATYETYCSGLKDPGARCCCGPDDPANTTPAKTPTNQPVAPKAPDNDTPNNKYTSLTFNPQVQLDVQDMPSLNQSAIQVGNYDSATNNMISNLLGLYIKAFYTYGLEVAGILAAIVLMAGGVLWLISAGDSSKIGEAKELIVGSLVGSIILFSSWIILNTINPNLLKLVALKTKVDTTIITEVGCCTDPSTKASWNTTQKDCGSANQFYADRLVDDTTKSCLEPSTANPMGCCIHENTDAVAGPMSLTSTGDYTCDNVKQTMCAGDNNTFKPNQDCNQSSECNSAPSSPCTKIPDGDPCNTGDLTGENGHCFNKKCYQGDGALWQPCGSKPYAMCTAKYEGGGCAGPGRMPSAVKYYEKNWVHDTSQSPSGADSRSCASGLRCCAPEL